ncbi:MAG: YARHG domain-containing protein [Lachnospiraceae bacterium]|nr:YARHG domain-containing protein [Lachnospiraceae bacterium]
MRHCIYCGMPIDEDDRFCVRCGKEQPAAPADTEKPAGPAPDVLTEDATVTVFSGRGVSAGVLDDEEPETSGKPAAAARSAAAVKAGRPSGKTEAAGHTAAGAASGRTAPGGAAAAGSRHRYDRRSDGEKKVVIALALLCLVLAGVMGVLLLVPRNNTANEDTAGTAAPAPSVTEASEEEKEEAAEEAARKAEEEAAREAEEEAARKAEEEAARKAEEEAARKAEEEAARKAQEEAEAKAAAEEEAARKAAEEAARKAEEEAAAAQRPAPTDSSYILPESSSRNYSYEELNQLDDNTLQMAINEIYARHGRRFSTPSLQEYFDNKTWYNGTIAPEAFDGNEGAYFNAYESANRELMARIRDQRAAAAAAAAQPAPAQPAAPAQ